MTSSADTRRKALVTGASGFIGSRLVRALVEDGGDVVALIRPSTSRRRVQDLAGEVEIVELELTEVASHADAFRGVRVIHHLAAAGVDPRGSDPAALVEANVLGTLRLLELARKLDVDRFVYAGSCFEYGSGSRVAEDAPLQPRSAYAATKSAGWLLAEAAAATDGLPVVALRPFTVYGPSEAPHRLIPSCVLAALEGRPIELTAGEQRRDFVYVDDAVEAFVTAASSPAAVGGVFNVCSGIATPVRDVAQTIATLSGTLSEVRLGAIPYRKGESDVLTGDPTRAQGILGYRTRTPLPEGLARSLEWFREHRHVYEPAEATG